MNTTLETISAPAMPDGDRVLRIKEVARLLRFSEKTVRRMLDCGQLPTVKVRGVFLIRWSDVQRLLKKPD
jgi:excisionase family DNA binding protein